MLSALCQLRQVIAQKPWTLDPSPSAPKTKQPAAKEGDLRKKQRAMLISTNAEAFDSSSPASSSRFERNVAVFGSSSAQQRSEGYAQAEEIGALLARRGCRVINGGYGGVMEATAKGAREAVPDAQVRGQSERGIVTVRLQ